MSVILNARAQPLTHPNTARNPHLLHRYSICNTATIKPEGVVLLQQKQSALNQTYLNHILKLQCVTLGN